LDHTENEHVSITEYMQSIEVYAAAIEKFASIALQKLIPQPAQ